MWKIIKNIIDFLPQPAMTLLRSLDTAKPPICENIMLWANSQSNITCISILKSQVIQRTPPRTSESEIHPEFLKYLSWNIPDKYLAYIPGAKLIGSDGLVILPDGSFALEVAWNKSLLQNNSAYYKRRQPKPIKHYGPYYSLMLIWCSNYYHWMHDVLQRLYLVVDLLPKDVNFVVPANLSQYQYESLRYLGIQDHQLSYFRGDEVWELELLYFSPPTILTGFDSPEASHWLRSIIFAQCGITPSGKKGNRRIFISRRLAKRGRRIVNEKEVEESLRKYGFETCLTEELSLQEQVILFSEAEIVVASHGAGLTNLLFCQSGTKVLEIFEPSIVRQCYWSLSEALGHNYWYFLGKTMSDNVPEPDIYVEIDKLENIINKMLIVG